MVSLQSLECHFFSVLQSHVQDLHDLFFNYPTFSFLFSLTKIFQLNSRIKKEEANILFHMYTKMHSKKNETFIIAKIKVIFLFSHQKREGERERIRKALCHRKFVADSIE